MTKIEKAIKEAIEPIVNGLNYKLYDVIYEKEAGENYLRIFIDNDSTISINDCEIVNNAITDLLDEKDFIKNQYVLEVSSPGLERRIRNDEQLNSCIGEKVDAKLLKKIQYVNKNIEDNTNIKNEINKSNKRDKTNKANKTNKTDNTISTKEVIGTLKSFDDKNVYILINDKDVVQVEKENIAKMNTVFDL